MYEAIYYDKDALTYLRQDPAWYRKLSRSPERYAEFLEASKRYHKKTWPDRLDLLARQGQAGALLLELLKQQK
ncbi:YlbE-like protein [Salsuginibacillus halophilus]|uniref:YlbE-like protein n=1 Tax=Salsuginibacillus halophilus TaxID=517424 RepID=A0A2P8HXD1_9BACI|nr:YlbE-like family protein [Salsuginibacillus halophilus]PSL50815.1 YlbE-like protein [Salsuginibacillus halophilus]